MEEGEAGRTRHCRCNARFLRHKAEPHADPRRIRGFGLVGLGGRRGWDAMRISRCDTEARSLSITKIGRSSSTRPSQRR